MASYIAVKNKNGEYKHYEVPQEVSIYIRQLENAVRYEHTREALARLYPERFNITSTSDTDKILQDNA